LADDFKSRFGLALDEEVLNDSHQVVIVAESLDESSERIVKYLSERGISINVLCFQIFAHDAGQLLSRAWLVDPAQSQINAAQPDRAREPWNGEFYGSFGHDKDRNWEDARELGFISAGGGAWYSRTLELLAPGDRVWEKVRKRSRALRVLRPRRMARNSSPRTGRQRSRPLRQPELNLQTHDAEMALDCGAPEAAFSEG